ncbi:hypothetical protein GRF61_23410 [Azoarcus sp. TTM-91]|uniref:hypothetical protein n=1 Tax=Azoarcus sp. TTM-91 TaxID=2691581 RepID=UPI00145E9539|nr:hypothetical protein [Azoarcus sp. TTM-91]NMG37408.1 hypothetical protein [Azoarcus sp. TTM-91]
MRPSRQTLSITALAALALLLGGCTKLTAANYERLKIGMSYTEVKALFGDPSGCSDLLTVKTCTWGDENRHVTVNFVADQVVLFNGANLK